MSAQLRDNPAVSLAYQAVSRQVNNTEALESTKHAALGVFIMFTMFTVVFQAGDILKKGKTVPGPDFSLCQISGKASWPGRSWGLRHWASQMAVLLV